MINSQEWCNKCKIFSFPASTFVAQFCTHSRASLITLSVTSKSRLPSS